MISDPLIIDSELGTIHLRPHPRAVRFTFRVSDGTLVATVPYAATRKNLLDAVEKLRPRLRELLLKKEAKRRASQVTPDFRIDVEGFSYWAEESTAVQALTFLQGKGRLLLRYPPGTDFGEGNRQEWIINHIEESLRAHAKYYFLPRLKKMAQDRGLQFQKLGIHKAQGRWGSCTSLGKIFISLYVMLLPHHLQDYVMQHELTHLVHMNHSERFWAELDRALGSSSKALRKELKNYDTSIFSSEAQTPS